MIAARSYGKVSAVESSCIQARLAGLAIDDTVCVVRRDGRAIAATVTALEGARARLAPLAGCEGIAIGDRVESGAQSGSLVLGMALLGRAIDSSGEPLDGLGLLQGRRLPTRIEAPSVSERVPITSPLWTGIRAVDALVTLGRGARLGVFGAPGVGKSTLLETIVEHAACDAVVLGLIGERGRESVEWVGRLGPRMTIVSAPADRPAAARVRAAYLAVAQAVRLRALGLDVLLVLDSVARFGQALRELAVASGEPVGRGGYPASVFARLARLLEAGGATAGGSLTMLASVLGDGDERDPLSEAAQALLDGHLMLSRTLAAAGHFPAIDVSASLSRTMGAVTSPRHRRAALALRAALAHLAETKEARGLGLAPGDASVLRAVALEPALEAFLRQGSEPADPPETLRVLTQLADTFEG